MARHVADVLRLPDAPVRYHSLREMGLTSLNHYRIAKALGSGGMGEVYLAEDTRLKRQVAIKILPSAVQSDPVRLERFEREAQVVAALNHPNIVTVHSVEQSGETHFITMEYVEGRTLAEVIPRGGLPLPRLLNLATQIADAIVAAHSHGIVHRDLKPANVMVAAGDRVKVLDFGLAKFREFADDGALPTRELTGEGKIVGTVAYMAPEQAEGRAIDDRSDIFSFGVILYELATGERPFTGDTSLSVLSSILRDTPRPVTELNPSLPRDVGRIVRHCLAKDPERRYQSAKDLHHDLEDLRQSLNSGELAAATPPAHATRRQAPWLIALAATLAVLALIGVISWRSRAADTSPTEAPLLSHSRLTQREGVERSPSLSPDGKWVVYVADGDIYLQSVSGQTAINLTKDSPSLEFKPAFSPDGETIAFRSQRDGGGIFLMGRTGESVRRLTAGGFDPSWFPDGRTIVYASGEGPLGPENRTFFSELWVVAAAGGEPRRIFAGDAVQPRVSPAGKRIAFWGIPSDPATRRLSLPGLPANRDIWTIDTEGGSARKVTDHEANDWNPVWSPDGRWLFFLSNRSGSMNLWRVAIDEFSGEISGEPQPLTAPASYVADFSLSADGSIGVYSSFTGTNNIARVALDPKSGAVKSPIEMVTKGANDFAYLDVTADGRLAAVTTSSRTIEDLYVIDIASGSLRQLTKDFGRDRYPRWSSDERQIYFVSDRRGYQLWTINADGAGLRQLTSDASHQPLYTLLSPDGRRLAATDLDRRELLIYDTGDFEKPPKVFTSPLEPKTAPPRPNSWSPDGRFLALTPQGVGGVWIYSLEDGTARRVADGTMGSWFADGRRLAYLNPNGIFVLDTVSGVSSELIQPPGINIGAGAHLAAGDSQLFYMQGDVSGDIWLLKFAQPDKAR